MIMNTAKKAIPKSRYYYFTHATKHHRYPDKTNNNYTGLTHKTTDSHTCIISIEFGFQFCYLVS